jgi:hypothetical protein
MAEKATKAHANYREGSPTKHCGLCTMFRPPHGCTAVKGTIEPTDVCDYFKRAASRSDRWYKKD